MKFVVEREPKCGEAEYGTTRACTYRYFSQDRKESAPACLPDTGCVVKTGLVEL